MEDGSIVAPSPITQVVIQATPFCNIDCSYCYLPDRTDGRVMSEAVLSRLFQFLRESDMAANVVELRWHAGEPLVAGLEFYRMACEIAETIVDGAFTLRHSVQTNGMLISQEWCRFFADYSFRIGVSIDGPQEIHDLRRRTRSGQGTFDKTLDGIRCLRESGLVFDTISVVTSDTVSLGDAFRQFFEDLRPRSIGLNVEESEGDHVSDSFAQERFLYTFRAFLTSMLDWERRTGIPVRELARVRQRIFEDRMEIANDQNLPMAILTVDVAGNLYTFSPELAGLKHSTYETFSIGNILTDSLPTLLKNSTLRSLSAAISSGVEQCRNHCDYYRLCGGGAPINKLFENGVFESSETAMCRCTVKAVVDVVLSDLERS